jgi:hypothetical protein
MGARATGQIANCRVQWVADPSAAMQQLNGKVVLVPFADWPQHSGQPVAQSTEPAEPVDPGSEIARPVLPYGVNESIHRASPAVNDSSARAWPYRTLIRLVLLAVIRALSSLPSRQ